MAYKAERPIQEGSVRLLSTAQKNHYASLIAQREMVNAEIQRFAAYLSEEHAVTGDGWTLHHDRLEKTQPSEAASDIPL